MEKRNISFSPPDISEAEIKEVIEAMKSGWITTGPRTKEFERKLADLCNTERVVCLSSATTSEELNLRILEVGDGDEVIVPAYTYTATASAVIHTGAKVRFIDSQKDSCEMDYEQLDNMINERTKAVIAVDLGGVPCDYDKIYNIIERRGDCFNPKGKLQKAIGRVAVLADSAHGLGAELNGKMAGQLADFTDFSFHAVKNLTTAEGGATTWKSIKGIDNEELYHTYQLMSLHGQSKDALAKTQLGSWEYDIIEPWYKCNMTDIMAAIGLAQLERYPDLLCRRHEIIKRYDEVCDQAGILHLKHTDKNYRSSGHLYITRIPGISMEQRNAIIVKMAEKGISCNVHYKPLPMMTAYKKRGFDIADYPNAFNYFSNEITLPLHTLLSDDDVDYVVYNFKEIVNEIRSMG